MANRISVINQRALTLTVNDIEHIESETLSGQSVIKIFFQPGANIATALSQVTAICQTQLRQLPPGTTPPLIIQYSASTVPILQLGLSGRGLSEQRLFDLGANFIRVQLADVEGAAIPWPYGGKQRQVQVDLDPAAMQSKGLSPVDVVTAISNGNLILPSGTSKIGQYEYDVETNGSPLTTAELNDLPIKTSGSAVIYIRDVAHVRDGFPPQTNIVRVDGQRSALMTTMKTGNSSTLDIISQIKDELPVIQKGLPPQLQIHYLNDQSIFVRAAIKGVVREAIIAALLTAAMILVFLGSWRSTIIIAVSIPLSILTSLVVISALGETINIMTLGGFALAVGILVDDATVEIENINRNIAMGKEILTGDFGRRVADCRPGFCFHPRHLHCFRAHVFPDRRRPVPLCPAGGSRELRHVGVLPPLPNASADHGAVLAPRPRARRRCSEPGSASSSPLFGSPASTI